MSESNVPSTKEEVVVAVATGDASASSAEGGVSQGEFVVHTKHTCDACFLRPIIGKRYTSTVKSNYDLCARCFDAYEGEDIGLKEEVLARDKKHSSGFVLKLKIKKGGEEQVRRINVSDIWGKSISHLSFKKMMSIASSYATPGDKVDDAGLQAFIAKAKVNYIDEDGDRVTMTSNSELEDAFRQVLKSFPLHKPFRINVIIPKQEPGKGCAMGPRNAMGMPKRMQMKNMPGPRKAMLMAMENSPKFDQEFFVHARHTCDGCSKTPIIGTRYHAQKIPDFDLCGACFKNYDGEDLDFKPEIHDRDRRMQPRWLRRQMRNGAQMSESIAGVWNKANGDLAEFLKKLQESGGIIESATVYGSGPNGSPLHIHGSPPCQGFSAAPEPKNAEEKPAAKDATHVLFHASPPCQGFSAASEAKSSEEKPAAKDASESAKHDESFLSDAEGSIAEAIGRTLDVCVAAIEDAMEENAVAAGSGDEEAQQGTKSSGNNDVAAAAAAVAIDTFSVASSMVSSMTDVLKKMEEAKKADGTSQTVDSHTNDAKYADASTEVPSVVTGATILKSEAPLVEDASDGEDEWSVVEDEKKVQAAPTCTEAPKAKEEDAEDKSLTSVEPLSPVLLAKWDTELHQLHELGFLDDRKSVDVLESLEAAHVGVGSTEKVTINAALGRLLGERR